MFRSGGFCSRTLHNVPFWRFQFRRWTLQSVLPVAVVKSAFRAGTQNVCLRKHRPHVGRRKMSWYKRKYIVSMTCELASCINSAQWLGFVKCPCSSQSPLAAMTYKISTQLWKLLSRCALWNDYDKLEVKIYLVSSVWCGSPVYATSLSPPVDVVEMWYCGVVEMSPSLVRACGIIEREASVGFCCRYVCCW